MALPTSITKIGQALNFPCDTRKLWYHKDFFKTKKIVDILAYAV